MRRGGKRSGATAKQAAPPEEIADKVKLRAAYVREDGAAMVEVAPGQFVARQVLQRIWEFRRNAGDA